MAFFRNVFLNGVSKPVAPVLPEDQPDSVDSMFAGLNIKPRLPDSGQSNPEQGHSIATAPESQSAFSFVQTTSSFSFIAEEPIQRSTSVGAKESGLDQNGNHVRTLNRKPASAPIRNSVGIDSDDLKTSVKAETTDSVMASPIDETRLDDSVMSQACSSEEKQCESILLPQSDRLVGRDIQDSTGDESTTWQSELEHLSTSLSDRMINHWKTMLAFDESHAVFENDYISLLQSLSEANGDVEALKVAQLKAVEDEAYERADELDCKIQQLKSNILEIKDRITLARNGKVDIFQLRRLQIEQLQADIEGMLTQVIKLKESCHSEGQATIEFKLAQLDDKERHLTEESQRIKKFLDIINADLSRIQNEQDEVQSSIYERTKEFQLEKETICSNLKSIDDELTRLREQICLKESEKAKLRESMSEIDQKISQAAAAFDRQLIRIDNQRLRIEADRADILKDQEELLQAEKRITSEKQKITELEHSNSEFATAIDHMLRARKGQMLAVVETLHHIIKDQERRETVEHACEEAQLRLAEQDRKMKLLSKQQISIEEEIKKLEALIIDIDVQLPKLEDQKTSAVAARDFKSAGLLAKQLKQLITSKSDSAESIEKLKNDLDSVNESILSHESALCEARQQFESAEKELDWLKFEHLCKQISSLTLSKEGAINEELRVIEDQISQLTSSAETIGAQHSWELTIETSNLSSFQFSASSTSSHCLSSSSNVLQSSLQPSTAVELSDETDHSNLDTLLPDQCLEEIETAIEVLEDQLQKAIDSDNYDQADQIQTEIDKLTSQKSKYVNSDHASRQASKSDNVAVFVSEENNHLCSDDRAVTVSPGRQSTLEADDNLKDRAELPGQ